MSHVILFDAMNMVHRMHFAADPDWVPEDGPPVGFIHGVLGTLSRLRRRYMDSAFVFCWDGCGPCWRKEIYPAYKAKRKPRPGKAELEAQVPKLRRTLQDVLGYKGIFLDGLEGDDVIGILAHAITGHQVHSHQVSIYSNDEDYLQILGERTTVLRPSRSGGDVLINQQSFYKEHKLSPASWLHVRALSGEQGDNIPGIPGVGPVTAKLYVTYGADARRDWAGQAEKFRAAFPTLEALWDTEQRRLSYTLTKIPRSVDALAPYFSADYLDYCERVIADVASDPFRSAVSTDRYAEWREFQIEHPFTGFSGYGNELVRGV